MSYVAPQLEWEKVEALSGVRNLMPKNRLQQWSNTNCLRYESSSSETVDRFHQGVLHIIHAESPTELIGPSLLLSFHLS